MLQASKDEWSRIGGVLNAISITGVSRPEVGVLQPASSCTDIVLAPKPSGESCGAIVPWVPSPPKVTSDFDFSGAVSDEEDPTCHTWPKFDFPFLTDDADEALISEAAKSEPLNHKHNGVMSQARCQKNTTKAVVKSKKSSSEAKPEAPAPEAGKKRKATALKMNPKNVCSRAYRTTVKECLDKGMSQEEAKELDN